MAKVSVKARLVDELHAPARRFFPRRRVIVKGLDDLWQADLVDVRQFRKDNRGYQYILTVIDVFSKYAWALGLKSKNANNGTEGFKFILQKDRRIPKNLQTDMGKEFYNSNFMNLMKKYGINHYSTFSTMKASVVERFNRTLKNAMWKSFSLNGNYRWFSDLSRLVERYNNSKHRTIGMKPADVNAKYEQILLSTVYNNVKISGPSKYKISDKVRISKFKTVLDKGYTPNWTTEVFTVSKIQRTNPVTYLLTDSRGQQIAGGFYEHELQIAKNPDVYLVEKVLRKKGNKVYVKWLGFDSSHNSWINKTDVFLN